MPTVEWTQLRAVTHAIFVAAGAPDEIAMMIADSLVRSNLMGHDSHGVMRVPFYVRIAREGSLVPTARPSVTHETATTALVDGNWGFGQLAARFGAEQAIQKARETLLAAVGVVRCNHAGRIGEYAEIIAEQGMVGIVIQGGVFNRSGAMTPHGGAQRLLGNSPYAFAVPAGVGPPVVLDFATSMVAEGKLQVAIAKKEPIPLGWILDRDGQPTTNAEDFYNGGMLLPFGGHKGYGLAVLSDILGGILLAADVHAGALRDAGILILALDIRAFRDLDDFHQAVDRRIEQVKSVPPAPGFDEVLVPGEPEFRTKAQREMEGIPIPTETWAALIQTSTDLGLTLQSYANSGEIR